MRSDQKRNYRSGKFGVAVSTSVPSRVFDDIESLVKHLGITKSEVVRRLVCRGLAEYQRDGSLPPLIATADDASARNVEC